MSEAVSDDQRWRIAPGVPWRVARLGVVVSVPAGTVVATHLAAEILVRLPATSAELAASLPDVDAGAFGPALDDLASRGVLLAPTAP